MFEIGLHVSEMFPNYKPRLNSGGASDILRFYLGLNISMVIYKCQSRLFSPSLLYIDQSIRNIFTTISDKPYHHILATLNFELEKNII